DLDKLLGGDAIARGMKLYYARWHHRHPSAADLREALADAAPEHRDTIHAWFDQQVYRADLVDDAVDEVESTEILPRPGRVEKDGKITERTVSQVEQEIADQRAAFDRDHPGDRAGGPFLFRNVVHTRRNAAQVPQTLIVEFNDGSQERLAWPIGERWHRWVFERASRVTQARLYPTGSILLDVNKLDDGRTREPHGLPARRLAMEGTTMVDVLLSLVSSL